MPIHKQGKPATAESAPTLPFKADRKPWKKRTPVEVVLEQADKLKAEIAEGEEELKRKRKQLQKFEEAKKIFETNVSGSLSLDMRDNAAAAKRGGFLQIEGAYFPRSPDHQNPFGKIRGEARS